jgi:uncharacterized protein YsxB (DUF464 family)
VIKIEAVLDENGILRACTASGHAGTGQAGDIVCSAVSVLMRTAFRSLSGREGITIHCDAPDLGFLKLEADYTQAGKDFLFAAGVFLTEGLMSVAEEYPQRCTLTIRRK